MFTGTIWSRIDKKWGALSSFGLGYARVALYILACNAGASCRPVRRADDVAPLNEAVIKSFL
jgi:hypothetical protein